MFNLYAVKKNDVNDNITFQHCVGKITTDIIWRLFHTDVAFTGEKDRICFNIETIKTSDEYKILVSISLIFEDKTQLTLAEFIYTGNVIFLTNREFYYLFEKEFSTFEILTDMPENGCVKNTKTSLIDALSFHIEKHIPLESMLSYIEYNSQVSNEG